MVKRLARGFFMGRTDEVDIEEIVPWRSLQRTRLDLGQVNVAQGKDAQSFEQRSRLIPQREYNGGLCLSLWFCGCL